MRHRAVTGIVAKAQSIQCSIVSRRQWMVAAAGGGIGHSLTACGGSDGHRRRPRPGLVPIANQADPARHHPGGNWRSPADLAQHTSGPLAAPTVFARPPMRPSPRCCARAGRDQAKRCPWRKAADGGAHVPPRAAGQVSRTRRVLLLVTGRPPPRLPGWRCQSGRHGWRPGIHRTGLPTALQHPRHCRFSNWGGAS